MAKATPLLEPLRLSGGFWGHLVGDALGVPYEFRSAHEIGLVRWGDRGTHGVPAGTWSDDGALMLALLDSLLKDPRSDPPRPGGFDLQTQARGFVRWRREGAFTPDGKVFDIGNATRAALDRLEAGVSPETSGGDDSSLGNGSLMRSVAIALAGRGLGVKQLVDQAERSSAVTHGARLARVTCALYVLICRRLLRSEARPVALNGAIDDLRAVYRDAGRGDDVTGLDEVLAWPGREGRSHVVDSFWSAWDAFADADSYIQTVERAIHLGRDTDTTACIAGAMAGIHWGLDAIPEDWLGGMRGRAVVQPIVDRLVETAGCRTSYTSPLRVDWIPSTSVPDAYPPWQGRLGMTLLPGKQAIDGLTGRAWRDVPSDIEALEQAGTTDVLILVEEHELVALRTPQLPDALKDRHIEVMRLPIPDRGVPSDSGRFGEMLHAAENRIWEGSNVVVACRGGLGRTGLVVACMLVDAGLDAEAAISLTRMTRRGTIETRGQEDFVRAWQPLRHAHHD